MRKKRLIMAHKTLLLTSDFETLIFSSLDVEEDGTEGKLFALDTNRQQKSFTFSELFH